jgi:dihydroorotase
VACFGDPVRARQVAEREARAGASYVHIANAPGDLSDLLDLLRPGDVLTHAYNGLGNNTVMNGKLPDAALAASQEPTHR